MTEPTNNKPTTTQNLAITGSAVSSATAAQNSLLSQKTQQAQNPKGPLVFPPELRKDFPWMCFKYIQYRQRWDFKSNPEKISSVAYNTNNAQNPPKTIASIYLPLPHEIQSSVNPQWEMQDTLGTEAIMNLMPYDLGGLHVGGGNIIDAMQDLYAKTIESEAAVKKAYGIAINPKKQAFFQGIDARQFTFNWTFTPKSSTDAYLIDSIIRTFTVQSLPMISADHNNTFFGFPSECFISFGVTGDSKVEGFPDFHNRSLVCTNVTTNWTPQGVQLLKDGHSVQTALSLSFLETTIRTQDHPGI